MPMWQCGCRSDGRTGPADSLDGSELTMCATCGCGDDGAVITLAGSGQVHDDTHPHDHPHGDRDGDGHAHTQTVSLEQRVLAKNDLIAEQNRGWLTERNILALNIL